MNFEEEKIKLIQKIAKIENNSTGQFSISKIEAYLQGIEDSGKIKAV